MWPRARTSMDQGSARTQRSVTLWLHKTGLKLLPLHFKISQVFNIQTCGWSMRWRSMRKPSRRRKRRSHSPTISWKWSKRRKSRCHAITWCSSRVSKSLKPASSNQWRRTGTSSRRAPPAPQLCLIVSTFQSTLLIQRTMKFRSRRNNFHPKREKSRRKG